ncbi:MAG: hypothetical protein U0610_16855 [bacterium]
MSHGRTLLAIAWLTSLVASYRLGVERDAEPALVPRVAIVAASPPPAPLPPAPRDAAALTPAQFVARGVVAKHVDEDNPLDRNQHAYVLGGPEDIVPAQVGLLPIGANRILFSQYPRVGAPLRTFSIAVN